MQMLELRKIKWRGCGLRLWVRALSEPWRPSNVTRPRPLGDRIAQCRAILWADWRWSRNAGAQEDTADPPMRRLRLAQRQP
jgi:hypothetical protein